MLSPWVQLSVQLEEYLLKRPFYVPNNGVDTASHAKWSFIWEREMTEALDRNVGNWVKISSPSPISQVTREVASLWASVFSDVNGGPR